MNSLNDDDRKLASQNFRFNRSISDEFSHTKRKYDFDHMTHAIFFFVTNVCWNLAVGHWNFAFKKGATYMFGTLII